MSLIGEKFAALGSVGKKALMPYIVAGYPSLENSYESLIAMKEAGADLFEIGIPFSDPIADGPTIQRASNNALNAGVNTDKVFNLTGRISSEVDTPLIAMCYYNLIFSYGVEEFAKKAAGSGIAGVIVPDLPPEEAREWRDAAARSNIDSIFLVTPTTTDERLKIITEASNGFVYCVSLLGVTGARDSLPTDLSEFIDRVRKVTDKPLAVGFGISTIDHVKMVGRIADGVVIGSAIVDLFNKHSGQDTAQQLKSFIKPIARSLHGEKDG